MYVYIIKSKKIGCFYVGVAENVKVRIQQHNRGENRSTKAFSPWEIAKIEEYSDKTLALKREKFLKSGVGRRVIRNLLNK